MLTRRSLLGGTTVGAAVTLLADRADAAPVIARTLATGLQIPWGVTFLPNGDGLVTSRETGEVFRVLRGGGRSVIGVVPSDGAAEGEGGLLGVALSPTFDADRFVFFYRTHGGVNQVVRTRFTGGVLSDVTVILDGIPAGRIHNGGRIKFGPDRMLYVATGEAGTPALAQDLDSLGGKILRIRPDGSAPSDNPFPRRPLLWTVGHRNVQGLAWDGTRRMWATELGQSTRDELNHVVRGHNYGWPLVEGGDGPGGRFHDPFVVWSPTSTCSPSGLAVTRGRAWVGALRGQALWSVELFGKRARRKTRYFHERLGRIRTVERAPDGSLWLTTSNGGSDRVVRVAFR